MNNILSAIVILLFTPIISFAQVLKSFNPTPELIKLATKIEEVRSGLAAKFGIDTVYIGGGSSRAILDHLYFGKSLDMRDIDVFVVADQVVTDTNARQIGIELESTTLGKFSKNDLRPRPRGNPNLPIPAAFQYNAGFGFFWIDSKAEIFDISIYHQMFDLALNGIFDIDTIMIPLKSDLIQFIRSSMINRDYSELSQSNTVIDKYKGYISWQNKTPIVVHWAEFERDPILQGIRVARTLAKVSKKGLQADVEKHILEKIAHESKTNKLQIIRNLLKLLEDKTAAEELKLIGHFGVLKKINLNLDSQVRARSIKELQNILGASESDPIKKILKFDFFTFD